MQVAFANSRNPGKYYLPVLLAIIAAFLIPAHPLILVSLLTSLLVVLFIKKIYWILYIAIIIGYTRADAWLTYLLHLPFGMISAMLIGISLSGIIAFTAIPINKPNTPFLIFSMFYVTCFIMGALFGDKSYVAEWSRDASYAFIIFVCVFMLASNEKLFNRAVIAVVFMGIVLSIINIVELMYPGTLKLSHSLGRSAGLLKNANSSAFAIICSYVLLALLLPTGKSLLKSSARFGAQVLLFIGVLSTFSREGFIFLLLAFFGVSLIDRHHKLSLKGSFLSLIFTIIVSYYIMDHLLTTNSTVFLSSYVKIYSLIHGNLDDNYRLYLLNYYISKLIENPISGYGFYSTIKPSLANADLLSKFGVLGPHNTFVSLIVDFGFPALLAYVFFYFSVILELRASLQKRSAHVLMLLASILILHNLFAHDFTTTRYLTVLLGLICAYTGIRR